MKRLSIKSEEAELLIWLMSNGFYIPLNTINKDHEFAYKISDTLALQKRVIKHLKESLNTNYLDELLFDTNVIAVITLILFHSSLLMNQTFFWKSHDKARVRKSIDRFAKQDYSNNTQFITDLTTLCEFAKLIELYLTSKNNLAFDRLYEMEKPTEYPTALGINYLVPVRPAEYSEVVSEYFELFFGGYESSNKQHVQVRKKINAFCQPFDEDHMLVSKDVAQALIAAIQSKEIRSEWDTLIKGMNTCECISLIKSSKETYSENLGNVFPKKDHFCVTVSEKGTIQIPKLVLEKTKQEYHFVFHQDFDGSSSLVELITVNTAIAQFMDMVLFEDELSVFFKKLEYAQMKSNMALPLFCDVKPNDAIYLMPEGVRIGVVEKREYDTYVQEYKKFIQK